MTTRTEVTTSVLDELAGERIRQHIRYGQQDHPNGTGAPSMQTAARHSRLVCDQNFARGNGAWADILREEFHEALAEADPARLRAELIQVAAVAVAWVEAIDRAEAGQ